ncbi:MAG: hypothetical protein QG582_1424 [Candidatus Thermoplasmatota archaeon]|nr:hypothetical protein [Candidatus Thermoplasmatota archaeon]
MVSKWVKAVFMVILGFLLLMYGEGFVDDMETNSSQEFNMSFQWTWDLVTYLIWILIAWLFVYALLTIVMSLKADPYTLGDVMERLDRMEKRLGPEKTRTSVRQKVEDAAPVVTVEDDGVPPPPRE